MKHIKPYKIFESQQSDHPGFPTTEEEIHKICKKYEIENYTINDDLSIDVGVVELYWENLIHLPLKFNYVSGLFDCSNNNLISLEGAPNTASSHFYCSYNKLSSLEGAPHTIYGDFDCANNNLKSLEGGPHTVGDVFDCYGNELMSLNYLPNGINYSSNYTTFENNPIYSVVNTFIKKDNTEQLVQEFNDYDIVRDNKVILNRLKVFCSDFDLEIPDLDEVKKYYEIV